MATLWAVANWLFFRVARSLRVDSRYVVYIGEVGSFANTVIDCKGSDNSLQIGDRTSIQSAVFSCNELDTSIDIGEDSMLSDMVVFSTGDGHPVFKVDTFERVNPARRIATGRHVWFTANA